jgi:hypothetical protein
LYDEARRHGDGPFDLPVYFGIAGGRISAAKNVDGPGSTFHFVLPIAMEPTGE